MQRSHYGLLLGLYRRISPKQAPVTQALVIQFPQKTQVFSGKEVQVPDWEQISFNSFPPATESGSLEFPQEILSQLDYDPSRSWQAGDLPSSFMMLGDVASALG